MELDSGEDARKSTLRAYNSCEDNQKLTEKIDKMKKASLMVRERKKQCQ